MDEKNENISQYEKERHELRNIDSRSYIENESNSQEYSGAAVYGQRNMKIFLVISWISAAFTAFVSPYFVLVGITFGILSNRIAKGSGNAVIITNIVLAAINFIFWIFMMLSLGRIFV